MSGGQGAARLVPDDEILSAALIAQHRLSDEDVRRVYELMQSGQVGFGEAAVRASVVTASELQQTLDWIEQEAARRAGAGIFETALRREGSITETTLRKRSPGQQVVMRHARMVKPSHELLLAHQPYHERSERVRSLRTELLLLNESSGGASIAVLSPGSAEGRSLLAAELAIAFSQLARPTLLVDADLRHPRQHQLYGAANDWGLAQAMAFHEAPQLLGVEGSPYLSVLTAGPVAPNPLELLSDGRFAALLRTWREQFDFILIDTPPVGAYADGLAIAALADEVLIVSRAEHTAHRDMKAMLRRLASTQTRIVGAVLNRF